IKKEGVKINKLSIKIIRLKKNYLESKNI
ncbi:hypothetical protein FOXB_00687, partial [Fusarium oxysporum f. sp. conglutinans Fo5176]